MEILDRLVMGALVVGTLLFALVTWARDTHFWSARQRWMQADELIAGAGKSDDPLKHFKYAPIIQQFFFMIALAVFLQCTAMGWIGRLVEDIWSLPHHALSDFVFVSIDTLLKGLFLDFMEAFQISIVDAEMQNLLYYQVLIFLFRTLYSLIFAACLLQAYNCWRVRKRVVELSSSQHD